MYLNPPDAAVVLCVDEKSQIQALDRTAPILPLLPGTPERRTHDYRRHGTTNLYAALDVASGKVIADLTTRHRAEEFRRFLNLIDRNVPPHLDVHVIVDNSSTHKTPVVDQAGPATQAHEAFVALQVDARRAPRLVNASGGGGEGALAVLRRELATLTAGLSSAEVAVDGALSPRQLARAIRVAFDPGARSGLARRAAADHDRAGVAPGAAWPSATDDEWAAFRADDSHHAVYWVEEWPRTPVRPDFLSPLLLGTRCTRTVSLTVEAVPPGRAARQVEAARTADLADEELRRRGGFLASARRRRQQEGVARREEGAGRRPRRLPLLRLRRRLRPGPRRPRRSLRRGRTTRPAVPPAAHPPAGPPGRSLHLDAAPVPRAAMSRRDRPEVIDVQLPPLGQDDSIGYVGLHASRVTVSMTANHHEPPGGHPGGSSFLACTNSLRTARGDHLRAVR